MAQSLHDASDPRNADILININGELKPRAEAVVSVFDTGLDPWNTGWLVFIILSVIALVLITAWDGRSALAAHYGPSAR